MSKYKLLEFCSKYCKNDDHNRCFSTWYGLGFEANCKCICHFKNNKKIVLDRATNFSNTNQCLHLPSLEVTKVD